MLIKKTLKLIIYLSEITKIPSIIIVVLVLHVPKEINNII
jgi:hypothetical protein